MRTRFDHHRTGNKRAAWRSWLSFFIILALFALMTPAGLAAPVQQAGDDPDGLLALQVQESEKSLNQQVGDDPERDFQPKYAGLATGDANRLVEVTRYAWPFSLQAMGHTIASYQNYGSSPYFHHGLDILANSGTAVYNRSGGQVVNVENYTPGNDLYWEVAVLDPEGYIWQYHHIEVGSIPQSIWDKYAEYQANPTTGGFIAPNTHIGNIVYWPVVTFGERFNHIHLNILGAGGYVNGFAFHTLLNDTAAPQIQAIGLLQNNAIVSGTTISGDYSLYVRTRDLILHTAYYVPPYEITYSVDGGPEIVTWRFDNLPGGADRYAYVSELFVPPTCGNYDCRDFYINLGFATGPDRTFPSDGGEHSVVVTVRDDFGNLASNSFTWTVLGPPSGAVIWSDDFETNKGWATNPSGTDSATTGMWERGNPEDTNSSGPKQLGTTVSGSNDLVTGRLAGSSVGAYDIDNGVTSVRSPAITLPSNGNLTLSFYYYLAHTSNSSADDYLRVRVVGNTTTTLLEELGAANNDDGAWAIWNADLNAFAGQTVYLLVEAADAAGGSIVEAALDDVVITSSEPPPTNDPPVASGQSVTTNEDMAVAITLSATDPDGDLLTYSVVSGPSNGALSGSAPNLTYTPAADYNGSDSFTFVANDGQVDSNVATVSITVDGVNDAPVADDQSVTTDEDTAVAVTLSGSDVDGDSLTYSVVSGPSNGALSGSAPNLTYTPAADYNGSDSFTFVANDGQVDSNVATVSITVDGVNDAPVADDQSVTTDEDTAVAITLSGSDVDGDSLTYSVVSGPSNGALSGSAPNLTYTPAADYNGSDSFTFVANDGQVDSNVATVSITVDGVNDAPVADDQSVTTVESTSLAVMLTASDVDGDDLTYSVVSGPSHGTLSGSAPDLIYTPGTGYVGPDSFTFQANDGQANSNIATVSVTVTEFNEPPVADNQTVSTVEDTAVGMTLTASDPDPDPLTYSVVSGPSNGALSGSAPNLTYTPAADYNGSDSFTFVANDGQVDSNVATVSITVDGVNDAPVADSQSVTTDEDTAMAVTLSGSDVDGDSLTYSVVSGPFNGALSGSAPNLTYTPAADYNGSDSFTFVANDGQVDSNVATVSITVDGVNDAPVADSQSVTTDEDTAVAVTLSGSDVDGDSLTYSVVSEPSNGALSGSAPNLTYTPAADYNGSDSFTFVANDGQVDSNVATVSITVDGVNDAPVADDQSLATVESTSVAVTLTASDVEGDTLTFSVVSGPGHGTLSGSAPDLTYTPDTGYVGSDSFTFQANDGQANSNIATVSVTVSSAGPVVLFEDDFETDKGWVTNPNGSDPATTGMWERGDPQDTNSSGPKQLGTTVSGVNDLVTQAAAGSSVGNYDIDNGETSVRSPAIYLPGNGDLTLSFYYYLAHTSNSSSDDYLRVKVVGDTTVTVFEELGAANNDDGVWEVWNTNLNAFGGQTVYLLVEAADAASGSIVEAALDDVLIISSAPPPPNDPPVADDQSTITNEDTPLSITLTGSDPDGDALAYEVVNDPLHGSLSGTAPNLTYAPAANYNGMDSFTFTVNDGQVNSSAATVSISVNSVNDAPVATGQSITTQQDSAVAVSLSAFDVDGDSLTFGVVSGPTSGNLSGTAPNLTYTPNAGFTGSDSFTFKANDGVLDSNVAMVSITVNPAGPTTVFADDFETNKGWVVNPNGTDTATTGQWERANPQGTSYSGTKQRDDAASGSYDLVTGPLAGSSAGSYDIDGGVTSVRSPNITLPVGPVVQLSFAYYMAHLNNSSTADYLRVKVVGSTTVTVFQELGATNDDDAVWASFTADISQFAGQTVYILIEAADASGASLVEAAVDDVSILANP